MGVLRRLHVTFTPEPRQTQFIAELPAGNEAGAAEVKKSDRRVYCSDLSLFSDVILRRRVDSFLFTSLLRPTISYSNVGHGYGLLVVHG